MSRAWAVGLTALVVSACGGTPLSNQGGSPSDGGGGSAALPPSATWPSAGGSSDAGKWGTTSDAASTSPLGDRGAETRRPYRAIGVVTGEIHACALLEDHQVKCWGDNETGQL